MLSLHQVDKISRNIFRENKSRKIGRDFWYGFFFILATLRQRDEKHNPNLISI